MSMLIINGSRRGRKDYFREISRLFRCFYQSDESKEASYPEYVRYEEVSL